MKKVDASANVSKSVNVGAVTAHDQHFQRKIYIRAETGSQTKRQFRKESGVSSTDTDALNN